ncbi:phosphate/phosphite/phosphonate ABC transporter substrate-binding protein [Roseibium sp.]|uniref:phosphate/phosphite/phosphonate ABC transporter substrate-binding protein n=1 Tax=Roseibium sp. TaxID=1936156 RepID=UPI003A975E4B
MLASDELTRLRFGVAIGADEAIRERIEPFRLHLEDQLDLPVDLFLIDTLGELAQALAKGDIDYARLSPASYAAAAQACGCLEPLASATPDGFPPFFYAVLVAKGRPQPVAIADLKGARLGVGASHSIGSYRVPLANLLADGIDARRHFRTMVRMKDPLDGLQAVVDGRVEASLAWSTLNGNPATGYTAGTLNDFYLRASPGFDKLQVVWRSPPIPYTAHAVNGSVPDRVKQKLRATLVELKETAPDVFIAVEPDFPGGLKPAIAADFRAVTRSYEPAFLEWLEQGAAD